MPLPITIRAVADTDIDAVVDLWERAGVARPWNDARHDIAFARSRPHATLLVAADANAVVATAMVGEDGHRGWVYYVCTTPDRQGEGIGRAMMAAAEHWLAARGIWKVQLLVRADNGPAKAFYERVGYVDTRSTCMQKVLPAGAAV